MFLIIGHAIILHFYSTTEACNGSRVTFLVISVSFYIMQFPLKWFIKEKSADIRNYANLYLHKMLYFSNVILTHLSLASLFWGHRQTE